MERKYKLTDKYIQHNGHKLYRIQALKSFAYVEEGDFGGYIESEDNLSHNEMCWVYDDAKIFGNAEVCDDAKIFGNAEVCDDANVYGNAKIFGNAEVYGNAKIFGNVNVCDDAKIFGNAEVYGNANVCDDAKIFGNAEVYGEAKIFGNVNVCDDVNVYGNAKIFGNANVCDDAKIFGNAEVYGDAKVYGNAEVYKNGDYIVFKNWWSSGRYFTWTRSNNMWKVGCFYGTGEELIMKAYNDSKKSGREYERVVKYVESILADDNYIE